jgi:hypothetical protein
MKLNLYTVDGSVTHQEIMAAMNSFIRLRNPEKLTIVGMDNASVHRKAVEEAKLGMVGDACLGLVPPFLLARTKSDRDLMGENQIRVVALGCLSLF